MPKFSANLGFLWADRPLPARIEAAAEAGFGAVECHWPYDTDAAAVRHALNATGLRMLALNTPPGDLEAGDFGLGAVPGREQDARQAFTRAVDYACAIGAQRIHAMAGICEDGRMALHQMYDHLAWAGPVVAEHEAQLAEHVHDRAVGEQLRAEQRRARLAPHARQRPHERARHLRVALELRDREHAGRGLALVWRMASLVLVASISGAVASALTVANLRHAVDSVEDLAGLRLAAVGGTVGAEWLEVRGMAQVRDGER